MTRVPIKDYKLFKRLILEENGRTTEIDHLIVSKYGIFVIESKNFSGCKIIGYKNDALWTQKIGNDTFKFQNPIRQNYKHVCFIRDTLAIEENKIKSVIIFSGFAQLERPIDECVVYVSQAHKYIKSFVEPILTDSEVNRIIYQLKSVKKIPRKQHIEKLQQKSIIDKQPKCPKCSVDMIIRHNKKTGEPFWACPNYPKCREMKRYSKTTTKS